MSDTLFENRIPQAPKWIKVTKSYTNFATAALINDISIYTLTAKQYIHDIKIVPTTAFSGGVVSSATMSVGITGALTKYAIATNIFTGNTTTNLVHAPLAGLESTSGSTDIRGSIVIVGVAMTLNDLTAGSVDFYLLISTLP